MSSSKIKNDIVFYYGMQPLSFERPLKALILQDYFPYLAMMQSHPIYLYFNISKFYSLNQIKGYEDYFNFEDGYYVARIIDDHIIQFFLSQLLNLINKNASINIKGIFIDDLDVLKSDTHNMLFVQRYLENVVEILSKNNLKSILNRGFWFVDLFKASISYWIIENYHPQMYVKANDSDKKWIDQNIHYYITLHKKEISHLKIYLLNYQLDDESFELSSEYEGILYSKSRNLDEL